MTTILNVIVDPLTEAQALSRVSEALRTGKRLQVVTVNNEGIMLAQKDQAYQRVTNAAGLRLADSVGVVWAAHFLDLPRGGFGPALLSLSRLLFDPASARTVLPQTIPGSEFSLRLAELCETAGYPVFLLGAAEGVAARAGAELSKRYPTLKIAGALAGDELEESSLRETIEGSGAKVLLVAYGQPRQDLWIARNLADLPAPMVAVGVGGTFDYLAAEVPVGGKRAAKQPPAWIRRRGLEWLWRLFTQPSRWRRIVTAFPLFVRAVVRSKD